MDEIKKQFNSTIAYFYFYFGFSFYFGYGFLRCGKLNNLGPRLMIA